MTKTTSGSEVSFTAVAAGTTHVVFTASDGSGIKLTIPVNITAA